jgi:iron complex outermembrane receptor protein
MHQANYDVTGNYLDDDRQSTVWALYAQDEVAFTEGLHLTAGCRYDDYSTSGGQFNPRAALIWEPTSTSSLKVMAGSAFRAPNAYELYYSFPNYEEANTALTPETVQTYDFEWDQAFGKIHQFSLSLFRYTAQNLIVNALDTSTGLYDFQNLNKASANGIGAEYQIHTSDGVLGRLSYTYQRAQDDATGDWLSDSPQALCKASLQVPVIAHLSVAGEMQYSGTSLGYAGDANSPYALVNLKVSSQGLFLDGLDANFAVYNLFDTAYSVPVNFTSAENMIQDGLMVWGSLSYKL